MYNTAVMCSSGISTLHDVRLPPNGYKMQCLDKRMNSQDLTLSKVSLKKKKEKKR